MKPVVIKSTLFGILSVHSLFASISQASQGSQNEVPRGANSSQGAQSATVERIIQKRIVGFDPKQAIETLTYLRNVGIQRFEVDGSIIIPPEMVQDLMETASVDGLEVRILNFQNQKAKIKFAAHDLNNFDRNRIQEAKDLARSFDLKCDMDGKSM